MVASTSHDMRAPLNTILHMHNMIESELTNDKLLKMLKVSKASTNILIGLVNDTLDFY
jgi:signal transduction histidine kinase